MKGFNLRNLFYMRAFAVAWDGSEPIVQAPSAQLSWSHNITDARWVGGAELATLPLTTDLAVYLARAGLPRPGT